MNTAFYTAVTGLAAYQRQLDTVAHNIANVNTAGFKPGMADFQSLLYTAIDTNVPGDNMVGHGIKNDREKIDIRPGDLLNTEGELDFAISGDGFFCLDAGNKDYEYTRNGQFSIGKKGSKYYLVAADGSYVLDKSRRKI